MAKYSLKKGPKTDVDKTLNAIKQAGMLVADNERYVIYDLHLNELTVSITEIKSMQETRGHSHMDASEVYFFVDGRGKMQVGKQEYDVKKGNVILVHRGQFHKVINLSNQKLIFVTVFEGTRTSKRYQYSS